MSQNMTIDECIAVVEQQERMLCFPHFSRKDVWELGQLMALRVLEENLLLSITIRRLDDFVLFRYMTEGTTANNEDWMIRKFRVVRDLEMSSLLNALRLQKNNRTIESKGLDPRLYAASGGGFPVRVAGTGLVGAIVVSGLPQLVDHGFIVDSISRFLDIRDVPRIPVTTTL